MVTERAELRRASSTLSQRAKRSISKAFKTADVDHLEIGDAIKLALEGARLDGREKITLGDLRAAQVLSRSRSPAQPSDDPFGLRNFDFSTRTPERSEMFTDGEAQSYIDGCDYPESADDLLLAWEVQRLYGGPASIRRMRILDAMCGPGRLGREFLKLGSPSVVFHDGDERMIANAREQAGLVLQPKQNMDVVTSPAESIPLPDKSFDLVVCHNSTHQLSSEGRLGSVLQEFLRLVAPGKRVVIADYQRAATPRFLLALEDRLRETRPEIVPLLVPTFMAAFSRREFGEVIQTIPGVRRWSVTNAEPPVLTAKMRKRVETDPVKGHLMDYSPISLRAVIQKE